jgi:chromosome partitioning protein
MASSIAVVNAKGGVGKTTLVLALAETLSAFHDLKVLVVDSDAHASLSSMLLPGHWIGNSQAQERTFVDYLIATVLTATPANWQAFVVNGVSDVDEARSIDVLVGGGHLTLFEREVSKGNHERGLRSAIRVFLAEACQIYDLVLIDSAPGLSVLAECWLREADFYLSPAKPDYLSTRGLQFLHRFGANDVHLGFAQSLGVIISMEDLHSPEDKQIEGWLRNNAKTRCFKQAIPRTTALQAAAYFSEQRRSFVAKYPGGINHVLTDIATELLDRLEVAKNGSTPLGARMILPTHGGLPPGGQ